MPPTDATAGRFDHLSRLLSAHLARPSAERTPEALESLRQELKTARIELTQKLKAKGVVPAKAEKDLSDPEARTAALQLREVNALSLRLEYAFEIVKKIRKSNVAGLAGGSFSGGADAAGVSFRGDERMPMPADRPGAEPVKEESGKTGLGERRGVFRLAGPGGKPGAPAAAGATPTALTEPDLTAEAQAALAIAARAAPAAAPATAPEVAAAAAASTVSWSLIPKLEEAGPQVVTLRRRLAETGGPRVVSMQVHLFPLSPREQIFAFFVAVAIGTLGLAVWKQVGDGILGGGDGGTKYRKLSAAERRAAAGPLAGPVPAGSATDARGLPRIVVFAPAPSAASPGSGSSARARSEEQKATAASLEANVAALKRAMKKAQDAKAEGRTEDLAAAKREARLLGAEIARIARNIDAEGFRRLIEMSADKDAYVSAVGTQGVLAAQGPEADREIAESLKRLPAEIAPVLVWAAGDRGLVESRGQLVLLASDPRASPVQRALALDGVARLGTASDLALLVSMISDPDVGDDAAAAACAVIRRARVGGRDRFDLGLPPRLTDHGSKPLLLVRLEAALADVNAIELLDSWSRHQDPLHRQAAASAIRQWPCPESLRILERLAKDEDPRVRAEANVGQTISEKKKK